MKAFEEARAQYIAEQRKRGVLPRGEVIRGLLNLLNDLEDIPEDTEAKGEFRLYLQNAIRMINGREDGGFGPIERADGMCLWGDVYSTKIFPEIEGGYVWRKDDNWPGEVWITLDDIREQIVQAGLSPDLAMVIHETPLGGSIYKYGNHGPYWEIVGRMRGYA